MVYISLPYDLVSKLVVPSPFPLLPTPRGQDLKADP